MVTLNISLVLNIVLMSSLGLKVVAVWNKPKIQLCKHVWLKLYPLSDN